MNYHQTQFVLSAAKLSQLPPDEGVEVAIIGRSNAGKSSVLNQLTHNKKLARVSKTPGRTQLLNIFAVDERHRIVDLPGYGYAKVPTEMKNQWQSLIDSYLRKRTSLKGLILVMDIRHPLKPFDQQLLAWCNECQLPVHILLNKADKLSLSAAKSTMFQVQKGLTRQMTIQIFSALKGTGVKELTDMLDNWFDIRTAN